MQVQATSWHQSPETLSACSVIFKSCERQKLKAGQSGWTCRNGGQFGMFYMDLDLHNKQEDHTLDCRVEQLSYGKILHMGWEAVT